MPRLEARDLRSLERRSMYSIFAPLDANERLPRELLQGSRRYPRAGRRELAVVLWYPIALVLLTIFGAGPYGMAALLAVTLVLGALVAFVFWDAGK